jgi:transposase
MSKYAIGGFDMPRYKEMPLPPDQIMLFGTSVADALPAESDVRSFNDVMECLDYSGIQSKCSSLGCPPYPPKEMVKILVYAYSTGVRSSRKIEHRLKVDIEFIWLAGGIKPDHNTIARFRKDNWEHLSGLFKNSVRVCMEAGLVHLSVVAVDGTKIRSAGSARRIYGESRLERELAAVDRILAEAEQIDATEDKQYSSSSGSQIPEHLRDANERKTRLKTIADRLRQTNRSTTVETEPDARVMRTSDGTRPCYNLQASVDAQSQVIVAMELTQHEVDTGELPEMIDQVQENTGCSPDSVLADCGYCDETTFAWIAECKQNVLMPVREQHLEKKRNDPFSSKCFIADDEKDVLICPAGKVLRFMVEHFCGGATYRQYAATDCQSCPFYPRCVKTGRGSRRVNVRVTASVRNAMRQKLASEQGKRLFALRSQSIEPVFGQIKSNKSLGRFLCWGLKSASAEIALACIAHNVRKCVANAYLAAVLCSKGRLRRIISRMIATSILSRIHASMVAESF